MSQAVGTACRMMRHHTLSLSFDDLGSLARAIAASTSGSSAAAITNTVQSLCMRGVHDLGSLARAIAASTNGRSATSADKVGLQHC